MQTIIPVKWDSICDEDKRRISRGHVIVVDKINPDGKYERTKARLVYDGSNQCGYQSEGRRKLMFQNGMLTNGSCLEES